MTSIDTPKPRWSSDIADEFTAGIRAVNGAGPAITVYGSARVREDHRDYQTARKIGSLIAQHHYAVVTGGGPGIMEAANRGAYEAGGRSVGIGITLPDEQEMNKWIDTSIQLEHFFVRKTLLTWRSEGFIVCPGGMGTLDEFSEVLTLRQTEKIDKDPIVFVNTEYWRGLFDWLRSSVMAQKYIGEQDLDHILFADTAEDAVDKLFNALKARRPLN